MEYIRRLRNFEPDVIAEGCLGAGLHEEAFLIYNNFNMNVQAALVLAENVNDLVRAHQFAMLCNEAQVHKSFFVLFTLFSLWQEAIFKWVSVS